MLPADCPLLVEEHEGVSVDGRVAHAAVAEHAVGAGHRYQEMYVKPDQLLRDLNAAT